MIDLVSPDFWLIVPLIPLGHIPFHLEVHGSSRTCTIIITYWMLIETWTWSLPYGAPRSIQLGPYFSTLGCHHVSPSGRTSWIYVHDSVMDSDDQCYMCDDRWFHDICSSDLLRTRCHTGAYFHFGRDLRIFMELHAHPHSRDTHGHDCFLRGASHELPS